MVPRDIEFLAKFGRRLMVKPDPFSQVRCTLHAAIIGKKSSISGEINHFDPSAGVQVVFYVLIERREIPYGALQIPGMDKVKRLGEIPIGFEVVNLEETIRRDPKLEFRDRSKRLLGLTYQPGWIGLRSVPAGSQDILILKKQAGFVPMISAWGNSLELLC